MTAAVLLADCPATWPEYPADKPLQRLWAALRLAWVHALWCVHVADSSGLAPDGTLLPPRRDSNAVVASVVRYLRERIRVAFCTCDLGASVLDSAPAPALRSPLRATPVEDFRAVWAAGGGVLCDVATDGVTGRLELDVRLTLLHPVAAPPAPPPQEGAA